MTEGDYSVVTLRNVIDSDAAVQAAFPPSAEIVRMYGGDGRDLPARSLEGSRNWVAWMQDHPYAKIIEKDGDPVGHLRLHSLSHEDRKARLGIGMFSEDFLGKGIGRRALGLALDDAFGVLGLHRVDLRVLAYNTRAIRCYLACGFTHEGMEREAAFIAGSWEDDWIMGVLAHEHDARRDQRGSDRPLA